MSKVRLKTSFESRGVVSGSQKLERQRVPNGRSILVMPKVLFPNLQTLILRTVTRWCRPRMSLICS